MLSQQALQEFKKILEEECQIPISDEAAFEMASNLLVLFDAIYHPLKREWLDKDAYGKH